ncbi:MAG: hypothetical protein JNG84_06075 [Archangium sp.]|nr:hypothetical protein [Archangium sp.]
MFVPALVSCVVVQAASLQPSSVPASGVQEAILTLDAPGMIHLSAKSGSGTACTVVDRVRGPFLSDGAVGKKSCDVDVLLDAGEYLVRVESPLKGKGSVALKATAYSEINSTPVKLVDGGAVEATLQLGQQATYGLVLPKRGVPMVRVAGRNAGDVRLWRNGAWLEPISLRRTAVSNTPGLPQYEWWLDQVVEAGEYTLVVYGRSPATETSAQPDASLTVEMGFRRGPAERRVAFTLPVSGVMALELPASPSVAFISMDAPPTGPVELAMFSFGETDSLRQLGSRTVAQRAVIPSVGLAVSPPDKRRLVAMVRGPRGSSGTLEWAASSVPTDDIAYFSGGVYGGVTSSYRFRVSQPQQVLVAVHDLPVDTDSAPLGCQLERIDLDWKTLEVVARSAVRVGDGEGLETKFNYDESGAAVWFDVARTGRYRIRTEGGRKSRCAVFTRKSDNTLARVFEPKPDAVTCDNVVELTRGPHHVMLYGGVSGIESLTVREDSRQAVSNVVVPATCTLPPVAVTPGYYRLSLSRQGAVSLRGVSITPLPVSLSSALHLSLDASRTVTLPLATGPGFTVSAGVGASITCTLERTGVSQSGPVCLVPAVTGADTLKIRNLATSPVTVTLHRPVAMPASTAFASYTPVPSQLQRVEPEKPAWFDFERGQTNSVAFDVATPGLYNVTTLGLLSTSCRLRTPVIDSVTENTNGGRGRNCLIQTYLQKGRYLFSATTQGQSKGRGALFLIRKPAREYGGVSGEGQSFFRTEANELVQQKIVVRGAGDYRLRTWAQGASVMCRLDDAQGWPVNTVPSPCSESTLSKPGTYLWTQLPLTVESMRRTSVERVREPVVLRGNAPHEVTAFQWYSAELGRDGKDEFTFTLEGETTLDVVLTQGMQGRLFRHDEGQARKAVEVIPPLAQYAAAQMVDQQSDSEEPESEPPPESTYEEGEGEGDSEEQPIPSPVRPVAMRQVPPPPSGVQVKLPAGKYSLVTEHSRGDVAVSYQLHLGSAVLMPGMRRTVPVPSMVTLAIPRDGTLRLRTEGEADVRCRLFNADGKLVVQSSDNGADWNCALAEPLAKGTYTLALESETQLAGETTVSLVLPQVDEVKPVTQPLTLGASVTQVALPTGDAVHEVTVTSKSAFSCAVVGPSGVASRLTRVTSCKALVLPKSEAWSLRLWTMDASTPVQLNVTSKQAVRLTVSRAGRYTTPADVWCLRGEAGAFEACGGSTSLESGSVAFAAFGSTRVPEKLDEARVAAGPSPNRTPITSRPSLQVVTAPQPSVFVVSASAPWGEASAPVCRFDGPGTVAEAGDASCFAVSRVGTEAASRVWAASDVPVDVSIVRDAVPMPSTQSVLALGRQHVAFSTSGGWTLPAGRVRLDLTLSRRTWAALVGEGGEALDLCAPSDDVRHCVMTGAKATLLLGGEAGSADVTAIAVEDDVRSVALNGVYELSPRAAGTLRLTVVSSREPRMAVVSGGVRCTVVTSNGARRGECRSAIPSGLSAEILVEHAASPVRAIVSSAGKEAETTLNLEASPMPAPALPAATSVALTGTRFERTLVVERESVVRLSAESGVCALVKASTLLAVDGLGAGCEVVRLVTPGTYRVLVRPFANQPMQGSVRWLSESVTKLSEGVAAESWLAPGEVRVFTFDTAGPGKVGLGLQSKREGLECTVYDAAQQLVGTGCQQYLSLAKGRWVLTVRNPPGPKSVAIAVRPVVLGLSGDAAPIPEDYLHDFFSRIGDAQ